MKTTLEAYTFYKAVFNRTKLPCYFKTGEISNEGKCIWLSFPPKAEAKNGTGIYHWRKVPFYTDYSVIVEDQAVKLTDDEIEQVIKETNWSISWKKKTES